MKVKTKEEKKVEKEKIKKWGLSGTKKIFWERITELELRIEELEAKK